MTENNRTQFGKWVAIGIAIGSGMGIVFHNIPIGTGLGVSLGVLMGFLASKRAINNR